jgi:hypothetical protein
VSHFPCQSQVTQYRPSYKNNRLLSGIIYVQSIADRRMGGTTIRNLRLFEGLCGKDPLKSVVVVTNMWGTVTLETGEAREQELMNDPDFFKSFREQGARFARHDGTKNSADQIVLSLISQTSEKNPLTIQIEMVDLKLLLDETAAAAQLTRDFDTLIQFLQKEIEKEEINMARDTSDNRTQAEKRIKRMRSKIVEIEDRKRMIGKGRASISLQRRLIQWFKKTLVEIMYVLRERDR